MKKNYKIAVKLLVTIGTILMVSSCSNTRFLEEGQQLYTGSKLTVEGDSLTKKEKSELKNQ